MYSDAPKLGVLPTAPEETSFHVFSKACTASARARPEMALMGLLVPLLPGLTRPGLERKRGEALYVAGAGAAARAIWSESCETQSTATPSSAANL